MTFLISYVAMGLQVRILFASDSCNCTDLKDNRMTSCLNLQLLALSPNVVTYTFASSDLQLMTIVVRIGTNFFCYTHIDYALLTGLKWLNLSLSEVRDMTSSLETGVSWRQ